jgi:hypothetical protein
VPFGRLLSGRHVTHGICAECRAKTFKEQEALFTGTGELPSE